MGAVVVFGVLLGLWNRMNCQLHLQPNFGSVSQGIFYERNGWVQ